MAEPKKQRVRYVGPYRRVLVPLPDGAEAGVDQGQTIEVPSEVAKGLLSQSTWEKAGGKPPAKKSEAAK